MIRKTMRVGDVRTSIKLEAEFWGYLKEVADEKRSRVSAVVNEIARATPERTNLASTLRTFALSHARLQAQTLRGQLERLALAGNTQDLARVLEACPLPCLVLDAERAIRQLNRAFTLWLNVDAKATLGLRLDNVMILRGTSMREMWAALGEGRLSRSSFNATYVSPGKVRTSQAVALSLDGNVESGQRRPTLVIFETLAGRS